MDREKGASARLGGTVVALVMAPIVVTLVTMVVGAMFALLYTVFTVLRPGLIGFMAACVAAVAGVQAARAACDAVLRDYAPRAVFVELALIGAAGLAFEATLPLEWARAAPAAQVLVMIVVGYGKFWQMRRPG